MLITDFFVTQDQFTICVPIEKHSTSTIMFRILPLEEYYICGSPRFLSTAFKHFAGREGFSKPIHPLVSSCNRKKNAKPKYSSESYAVLPKTEELYFHQAALFDF